MQVQVPEFVRLKEAREWRRHRTVEPDGASVSVEHGLCPVEQRVVRRYSDPDERDVVGRAVKQRLRLLELKFGAVRLDTRSPRPPPNIVPKRHLPALKTWLTRW
jgi:hypothetical protein